MKETGDDVAARRPFCIIHTRVGESRPELGAADHIWPGVVSPTAILPASTACCQGTVAPLPPFLSSHQSLCFSFSSTIRREHFWTLSWSPCSLCPLISPFPLLSSPLFFLLLFLSFPPKRASSAHPLSPCFPPSFVLSLVMTSCVSPLSPLSFCSRKLAHLGLRQCAGSTGRSPCTSF